MAQNSVEIIRTRVRWNINYEAWFYSLLCTLLMIQTFLTLLLNQNLKQKFRRKDQDNNEKLIIFWKTCCIIKIRKSFKRITSRRQSFRKNLHKHFVVSIVGLYSHLHCHHVILLPSPKVIKTLWISSMFPLFFTRQPTFTPFLTAERKERNFR